MHAIRCAALSFRALIATKLGACAFCIRLSLTLSVVSWLLNAFLSDRGQVVVITRHKRFPGGDVIDIKPR